MFDVLRGAARASPYAVIMPCYRGGHRPAVARCRSGNGRPGRVRRPASSRSSCTLTGEHAMLDEPASSPTLASAIANRFAHGTRTTAELPAASSSCARRSTGVCLPPVRGAENPPVLSTFNASPVSRDDTSRCSARAGSSSGPKSPVLRDAMQRPGQTTSEAPNRQLGFYKQALGKLHAETPGTGPGRRLRNIGENRAGGTRLLKPAAPCPPPWATLESVRSPRAR
jgi:hypothetical protein